MDKRMGVRVKLCDPLTTRATPKLFFDEVLYHELAIFTVTAICTARNTVCYLVCASVSHQSSATY